MQEYASTSQLHLSKTSCHDSKSFSKPPPPKTLHARVFLNFTASPIQDFLLDSKSFFTSPPQNLTCKSMPQLHSLPSPRLLVTIPSHFLNLPPKPYMQEYASTSQPPLSKTSCHDSKSFSKPPPQNPTCKSMPQPHSFTSPRLLVTIPSHFLNLPPQNLTCKSIPQLHSLPYPRLLVRF